MIVGQIVRQSILLIYALRAGWKFPRHGLGEHPTLGRIEAGKNNENTLAYAPDGHLVAVVDTFYDAWEALCKEANSC